MPFQNDILAGAAGAGTGYTIDQSCIFNDSDSPYLSKTFGSAGNRRTWTLSWWTKRCNLGSRMQMFAIPAAGGSQFAIECDQGDGGGGGLDQLIFNNETTGTTALNWELEIAFRDPVAWYHFVAVYDTTQSTTNDRFKFYVNGALQTDGWDRNTTPAEDEEQAWNNALDHRVGGRHHASVGYYDGYMAEIHSIDGTAKTASDFGETNNEGIWIPKKYAGSYGTNGFYLDFSNSAALGTDSSGNGHTFTSSGLAASDQIIDSPTNNYPVLSSLTGGGSMTYSQGNRKGEMSANYVGTYATFGANSGKWYFEYAYGADDNFGDGRLFGGVACPPTADHGFFHGRVDATNFYRPDKTTEGSYMIFHRNGEGTISNTGTAGAAYNTDLSSANNTSGPNSGSDIYMVALDLDNYKIYWGKNGTWYGASSSSGSSYTDATPVDILAAHQGKYFVPGFFFSGANSGTVVTLNCGQDSTFEGAHSGGASSEFYYDPPAGFSAICTNNLPAPVLNDPSTNFQIALYTGNGGTQSITFDGNSDMQPDMLWMKKRSSGSSSAVFQDAARGVGKATFPDNRDDEDAVTDAVTAFNSDGFSLGDGSELSTGSVNTNTETYVAWCWNAGNSGSSNEDGGINTTTTYADQTAGISISTYTGTGSATTVGHGLGATPKVVTVWSLSDADHKPISNWEYPITAFSEKGYLDRDTDAFDSSANMITGANSTTVSIGNDPGVNKSTETYLMICFVEKTGFSCFGTFTGSNQADGPFLYTGFTPRYYMQKGDFSSTAWMVQDTARYPNNTGNSGQQLFWNSDEDEYTSTDAWDFLSNGIKVRCTGHYNTSGAKYIYMAFAENPFGGEDLAPATAR